VLLLDETNELVSLDETVVIGVNQPQDLPDNLVLALLRNMLVGVVHQAVCAEDLLWFPFPVAVEVVEGEEGCGVKLGGVVLL
jgi:hypothetical protein